MFFEIQDKSLAARIGRIYTRAGYLETPALFPVIKVEYNPEIMNHIKRLKFRSIITNAYLLWKKFSKKPIDVHEYLQFNGTIMTDSGGYQVLKYGDVKIKPKESIEYQIKIKSDIGVILDYPTGLSTDEEFVKKSVYLTLRRASYARKYLENSEMIIVAPIQGGIFLELLEYCAKKMKEMGYEMFAIGSPTGLMEKYRYADVLKMVLTVKKIIGNAKPIHLFGAGHPMFFPFIVACGIDTFDSAAYSIYARDGRYLTRERTYRLEEMTYFPCDCDVCRKLEPDDLKSLDPKTRTELLEKHNLHVSMEEIKNIKLHIKEGTLWNYLEQKARAHPFLYEAFMYMKEHIDYFVERDVLTKVNISGIFFFDPYSSLHPALVAYHKRFLKNVHYNEEEILIILPFIEEKPFGRSNIMKRMRNEFSRDLDPKVMNRLRILFVGYPYIMIPLELSETYPVSQWEGSISSFPFKKYLNIFIKEFFSKNKFKKVIIFIDKSTNNLIEKIENELNKNYKVNILKILIKNDIISTILNNKHTILNFILNN